jgi:chromosomal replication initiator protein
MSSFWNHCLDRFEQELPPQQFNTWIRPLRLEDEDMPNKVLRLVAPNGFILKWVKDRYLKRVEDLAQLFFSAPIQISLTVGIQEPQPDAEHERARPPVNRPAPAVARTLSLSSYEKTRLKPDLTFNNLVVGKSNDLARAASQNVAANPGGSSRYNPLFIYGSTGLGKTHLIHAVGNHIVEQTPGKIIRYVHAADYFSNVVRAAKTNSFDAFKRYYQSLDVLLLDDVQYFGKKLRTQEEFFLVFNALIEANKQIVITCDTYPKNISELDDRLITRFDWGLTVQIEPPEIEMRVAILQKKAGAEGVVLDDDVAFYVAKHLRSNVRELEGALKKILAYTSFHKKEEIKLELVKEALKDLIGAVNHEITVVNIQKTVADYFKIKLEDLLSKKRSRPIARPRQVAMWLAKSLTSESLSEIGEAFGGRDHSTVINAVTRVDELREKDKSFRHNLNFLLQTLKGPE